MKDRVPTQIITSGPGAGAVRMGEYDAQGNFLGYHYLKREDAPSEAGMALNKANLLADSTAAALHLTQVDPTPNDALKRIAEVSNVKLIPARRLPFRGTWNSVCYGAGKYVAVCGYGDGDIAYSADGKQWTAVDLSSILSYNLYFESVCYGGGKFVAVGRSKNTSPYTCEAIYSTDGVNWNATEIPTTYENTCWNSVCYGNGKFVAVSDTNYSAYSSDGVTWTLSSFGKRARWTAVCYGNDRFVAVGTETDNYGTYSAYSTNGVNWIRRPSEIVRSSGTYPSSICYGNGKYLFLLNSGLYYSTDGYNWKHDTNLEAITPYYGAGYFKLIVYGNGMFVVVSNNDEPTGMYGKSIGYKAAAYSLDGMTWDTVDMNLSAEWGGLCWGNNEFVAVAKYIAENYTDRVAYSPDGKGWIIGDALEVTSIDGTKRTVFNVSGVFQTGG